VIVGMGRTLIQELNVRKAMTTRNITRIVQYASFMDYIKAFDAFS
jgi:hypothetical protein